MTRRLGRRVSSKSPLLKQKYSSVCSKITNYILDGCIYIKKYITTFFLLDGRYKIINYIGEGTFGKVSLAIDKSCINYSEVVIKEVLPAGRTKLQIQQEINQEIECYKKIGYCQQIVQYKRSFKKLGSYPFMVFEYVGYNLETLMDESPSGLQSNIIIGILYDILHGLIKIHECGYIHADIKDSNICVWYEIGLIRAKIIDLGGVELVSKSGKNIPKNYICTRYTRAPEILESKEWGTPIDLWSLGCVLYYMLCGEYIFNKKSAIKQLEAIHEFYKDITNEDDLIYLLKKNIFRYRDPSLIECPQMNNLIILLAKLLTYDQDDRITSQNAIDLMVYW